MKVKIEFEIAKKQSLIFAKIIEAISKILGGLGIKWRYTVESTVEDLIDE